uniref:Putative secreted protein n=1 Tax=Ixodes scapularis TaxID=6945 RepID=A0A4D5RD61_IXOSC
MRIWTVLLSFRFMTAFVSTALGFQGHSRYSLSDGDFSNIDLALLPRRFLTAGCGGRFVSGSVVTPTICVRNIHWVLSPSVVCGTV